MIDEEKFKKDFFEEKKNEIIKFIEDRARQYFYKDYPAKLVDAVLDLKKEPSFLETKHKLDALHEFSKDDPEAFNDLINIYKRVKNI